MLSQGCTYVYSYVHHMYSNYNYAKTMQHLQEIMYIHMSLSTHKLWYNTI